MRVYSEVGDTIPSHDNQILKNFLTAFDDNDYVEPKNYKKTTIQISSKESHYEASPIKQVQSDPFYLKKVRSRPKFQNKK